MITPQLFYTDPACQDPPAYAPWHDTTVELCTGEPVTLPMIVTYMDPVAPSCTSSPASAGPPAVHVYRLATQVSPAESTLYVRAEPDHDCIATSVGIGGQVWTLEEIDYQELPAFTESLE